jgi:hypothetical protein
MNWNDLELHRLAADFFRMFSRMEYALKVSGFLVQKRSAEANWTSFAEEIHDRFEKINAEQLRNQTTYLLREPPKKQINNKGLLEWDATLPDAKNQTDLLLQYVRRIRNNLFHGGKFNGHWFEPERSGSLINAGIEILNACLQVSDKVREAYDS